MTHTRELNCPEAGEAARAQEEEEAAGARPRARAALCRSDTRKRYCLCSCAQLPVLCRGAVRLHHNLRVGKVASALERAPWSDLSPRAASVVLVERDGDAACV